MSDRSDTDLLRPPPEIMPFPLDPSGTYDPAFTENLRAHYYNALPMTPEHVSFGPLYQTATAGGMPLTMFSLYTDPEPPVTGVGQDVVASRWILILAAQEIGRIAGFRTLSLNTIGSGTDTRYETRGYIETAEKGKGFMVPLELATRDLLTRLATRVTGKVIRHTVYNKNLLDLMEMRRISEQYPDDDAIRAGLQSKTEEQIRWRQTYERLGYLPDPRNMPDSSFRMYFDVLPSENGLHAADPGSLVSVRIARGMSTEGKTDVMILSQSPANPLEIRNVRVREYVELIRPVLGNLCYPEKNQFKGGE